MNPLISDQKISPEQFRGQFVLTAANNELPSGWQEYHFENWKLFVNQLPVLDVYDQQNNWLGWCLGYPIIDGELVEQSFTLQVAGNKISENDIDSFYDRAAGKWLLALLGAQLPQIYLDPYGCLAAVFSTIEPTLASTVTLLNDKHQWDEQLLDAMGLPQNDVFLIAGVTAKRNSKRLMPNHLLDVRDWRPERHWPRQHTDLSEEPDTRKAVKQIIHQLKQTIGAVSKKYPMCFSLTAGMDSRMILACAKEHLDNAKFFTFTAGKGTVDDHISELIAKRFNLNHSFLLTQQANDVEAASWLSRTGYHLSGSILRIHKSLYRLDADRVLMPGPAGEITRRIFLWRGKDSLTKPPKAKDLLTIYNIPAYPEVLQAMEQWLAGIKHLSPLNQLYMVYIEQRLGCWMGPQQYGNNHSLFEFSPFNDRKIFVAGLKLPIEYRKNKKFAFDLIQETWPELNDFPFNRYPGAKGIYHSLFRNLGRVKKVLKRVITAAGK